AREMWRDIARVLAGQQATAVVPPVPAEDDNATRVVPPVPVVPAHQPEGEDALDDDLDDEEDEEPRNRAGLIVFIVGLALLLIAGAAFGFYQWNQQSTPPPVTPSTSATPTPTVRMVAVPDVIGFNKEAAERSLKDAGLNVDAKTVTGKDDETVGTVVKQCPEDGEVAEGTTVEIEINGGPKQVQIPDNLI